MRTALLVAAAVSVACSGSVRGPSKSRLTTKEIVDRSKPAIVRVESVFSDGKAGVGTGFVVNGDGRIATNLHVIFDVTGRRGLAEKVHIVLLDGTKHPVKAVIGADPQRDLALLSIEVKKGLPSLPLGDSSAVSAGDRVIAIGNPLGVLDYTVSDGLISSIRPVNESLTMLQISAPISEGSSGGPLFNNYGEVIGVATMIAREGQNLNFAIPSNYLRPLIERRTRGESLREFGERFKRENATDEKRPPTTSVGPNGIQRRVPNHDVAVLDACDEDSVVEVFQSIGDAISIGAPIYNLGQRDPPNADKYYDACYRIYEGTALRLERDSSCKSLREALGQGLLRASTMKTPMAKAWAMRDAFDGVINVVLRKAQAGGIDPEKLRNDDD